MSAFHRIAATIFLGVIFSSVSFGKAVDFERQIQPFLEKKCYRCHDEEKVKGELRLDSPEGILAGGEYGDILIPGDPNESSIYLLTTYPKDDPDYMPQKGKGLTKSEQSLLKIWIEEGATFGEGFVHVPEPKVKAKFEEADPSTERNYMITGEAVEIVARLRESGIQVDTVNHDSSLFEVSYTYADRVAGSFDFETLGALKDSLVKLTLARTEVSSEDLSTIAGFARIEFLDLSRTSVGDDALGHVAKLENLKYLNLRDTSVTDEGLKKLAGLKQLEKVYLWGSAVTASGAKRLEKSLSGAEVNVGSELRAPRRAGQRNS